MRSLCLDLATVFGAAVGSPREGVVWHGTVKLPKTDEDIGKFLRAYRRWLAAAIEEHHPGEIVYEMPILPATVGLWPVRKLNGLCGVTEMIAGDYEVPTFEANLFDIRRHFLGVAKAPKSIEGADRRRWLKDKTIAECRARGFKPDTDNDADALALLSYRLAQRQSGYDMRAATARAA